MVIRRIEWIIVPWEVLVPPPAHLNYCGIRVGGSWEHLPADVTRAAPRVFYTLPTGGAGERPFRSFEGALEAIRATIKESQLPARSLRDSWIKLFAQLGLGEDFAKSRDDNVYPLLRTLVAEKGLPAYFLEDALAVSPS